MVCPLVTQPTAVIKHYENRPALAVFSPKLLKECLLFWTLGLRTELDSRVVFSRMKWQSHLLLSHWCASHSTTTLYGRVYHWGSWGVDRLHEVLKVSHLGSDRFQIHTRNLALESCGLTGLSMLRLQVTSLGFLLIPNDHTHLSSFRWKCLVTNAYHSGKPNRHF